MQFIKIFLAFLLSCHVVCLHAEENEFMKKRLTIRECQEIALKNSEDLSIQELETLIAKDQVREIQGGNIPSLEATGNYISRNNHTGAKFWERPVHGGEDHHNRVPKQKIKTVGGNKQVRRARLALLVPIYDFNVVSYLVKSQKMVVKSLQEDHERLTQDLLYAVTDAYYKVLESEKIEAVVKLSIFALKKQLKKVSDFFRVGLVTKNDVLVVEVQLAEREQELIQAKQNLDLSKSELLRLMGLNIKNQVQVENKIEECVFDFNLDDVITDALQRHPQLKSLIHQKQASVYDMKSEKRRLLPNITGFASANANSDNYLLHNHWVDFGLNIVAPIYDGGITNARIHQKEKAIQEAELTYQAAVKDIEMEIKNAFLDSEAALHKVPVAKKGVLLAEENLKIARDLFDEGILSSSDVLDDEERLDIARSNYFQALYAFHRSKSQLEYVAGLIKKSGDS